MYMYIYICIYIYVYIWLLFLSLRLAIHSAHFASGRPEPSGPFPLDWCLPSAPFLQPSEEDQIVFFSCFDLHHKSPDSGERRFKSRTCKQRFDPVLRA
jgi:hypothetical protein